MKARRLGALLCAVCAFAGVSVPTGTAGLRPIKLSVTGFAAEPVPPELMPSYWADDGRYITAGTTTWTTQPHVSYLFCLKNLTAPYLTYHREGCVEVNDTPGLYSWTFDPYTFPNDVGGVDGGFYPGETIALSVVGVRLNVQTGASASATSNVVYETVG